MKFTQPIKLVMTGNKAACHHYIRFAIKQLGLLERQMSFQGLNEGRRAVSPLHGVLVECTSRANYKEVNIYVQPESVKVGHDVAKKRDKQQVDKELQECIPYYFYVRIQCPNFRQGPTTDRLIIYEMEFNGLPVDTPLEDTYNANNNFTPGGGRVVADVDVISETVYFPEGLTIEDQERMVSMSKTIAENVPDIGNSQRGPTNYFDEWYVSGPLTNIPDSIILADYSGEAELPDEPTEIYLSEGIDVSSGDTFWFFTDPLEIPKYYSNGHYLYELWRADWSPLYGGKTTWYTNDDWLTYAGDPESFPGDGYPWEDLQQVAEAYYGKFVIVPYETAELNNFDFELVEEFTFPVNVLNFDGCTADWYDGKTGIAQETIAPYEDIWFAIFQAGTTIKEYELTGGTFYTAPEPNGAPSFFMVRKGLANGRGQAFHSAGSISGPIGTSQIYGEKYDSALYSIPWISLELYAPTNIKIVTPLEELHRDDFKTARDSDANCSEFEGTAFEDISAWRVISRVGSLHASCVDGIDDQVRLKICDYWGASREELTFIDHEGNIEEMAYKNLNTVYESSQHTSCFILDEPEQENLSCQTKFASLFYLDETVLGGKSGVDLGTFHAQCDGVVWDDRAVSEEDEAKRTYQRDIGCLLYIFAPREMYRKDSEGNKTYWDIHSARVDSEYINPFRCLEFEEYLLDVFQTIGNALDADPTLDKLREEEPQVSYTMEHYGYEIRTGFFRGG